MFVNEIATVVFIILRAFALNWKVFVHKKKEPEKMQPNELFEAN